MFKLRAGTSPLPWLALMAVSYVLMHHVGVGMRWLGSVGETRWADWLDILTPYLVLLPATVALYVGQAPRRAWVLFLIGAITYVEGHGIHLAANSVGNVSPPSDIVHFWDEVAGHYLWYGGVVMVFAALMLGLSAHPAPVGPLPYVLAVLVGTTFTTNALEGGTAVFCLAFAVLFTAWGWATRLGLGRLLLVSYGTSSLLLIAYGIWQQGFPEPSDLGWI